MAAIKIQADVDSAEFTVLKEKFDEYMVALAKAPAAWRGVGQELARTRTKFETVAESATAVAATVAVMHDSGKKFYEVTTATARHWHSLAQSTASVAKNIVGATESLLKWTGIVGLVTGGAGLFGFDRLAHSVAGQRQAALGTGGDYGLRQAFLVNMRRFGDPEGMLNRVAMAQTNIQSPESASLKRLVGLDLKGDPTEVAIKALEVGAKYASEDKGTPGLLGVDPRLEFFDQAERVRLRDKPGEVAEQVAKLRADQRSGKFNVSEKDQKAYQDFITQVGKAGTEIETVFVKGLVKLAGPLEELSKATVGLVDKFLEKALPAFIKNLADGVEWLSTEMTKDTFTERIKGIVTMVGDLATSLGGLLSGLARFAKWLSGSPSSSVVDAPSALTESSTSTATEPYSSKKYREAGIGAGGKRGAVGRAGGERGSHAWTGATPGDTAKAMSFAEDQLRKEGVPEANVHTAAAALVGNAIAESGLNPRTIHDQGTGYGIYGARLDRRDTMLAWEREHGFVKDSLEGQVREMAHQSITNPTYRKTREALMHATNVNTAGDVVEGDFERPKVINPRHAAFQRAVEVGGTSSESRKSPEVATKPDIGRGWQEALHKAQRSVSISSVPGGNTSLGSAAAASAGP